MKNVLRVILATATGLALWAAPALASPTCFGREATIVGDHTGGDIEGTPGNDVIVVKGDEKVTVRALGGADRVCGSSKNDTIYGGDGDDRLYGFSNRPSDGGGKDTVHGGDGNDRLFGLADKDYLNGDEGADTLIGGWGPDFLRGGRGPDVLRGAGGHDDLWGDEGDDIAKANKAGASFHTGSGEDLYKAGPSDRSELLYSGPYTDPTSSPIDADLTVGTVSGAEVGVDTLEGRFGRLEATQMDDTITGSPLDDSIDLGDGDDVVSTGNGNDFVDASASNDDDDQINLGDGDDRVRTGGPNSSVDDIDGGDGIDELEVSRVDGFTINLATQEIEGDAVASFTGMEDAQGRSEGPVTLIGDDGPNRLSGMGRFEGDDASLSVSGAGGDDTIFLHYPGGNNELRKVVAFGGGGDDHIVGNALLTIQSEQRIEGGPGNDEILGSPGFDDDILGGEDDDTIYGRSGEDHLEGNEGDDWIYGETSEDHLDGGGGSDYLDGGVTGGGWPENDLCLNGEVLSGCERTTGS